MSDPFDPYSFFGNFDRDVMIVGLLRAFLLLIYAIFDNVLLLIMAGIGIFGMIIVQAFRNHKRALVSIVLS
ncbi:MAG: hypothetical protein NTY03_03035 [Candidatus Bathyarchaeota archaeon]|nr:hypothetical protein [Candidatus Bathyarchaeota archaeon]